MKGFVIVIDIDIIFHRRMLISQYIKVIKNLKLFQFY